MNKSIIKKISYYLNILPIIFYTLYICVLISLHIGFGVSFKSFFAEFLIIILDIMFIILLMFNKKLLKQSFFLDLSFIPILLYYTRFGWMSLESTNIIVMLLLTLTLIIYIAKAYFDFIIYKKFIKFNISIVKIIEWILYILSFIAILIIICINLNKGLSNNTPPASLKFSSIEIYLIFYVSYLFKSFILNDNNILDVILKYILFIPIILLIFESNVNDFIMINYTVAIASFTILTLYLIFEIIYIYIKNKVSNINNEKDFQNN